MRLCYVWLQSCLRVQCRIKTLKALVHSEKWGFFCPYLNFEIPSNRCLVVYLILKFYNNITKTGFEFIIKKLPCALPQVHCSCSCRLQVATTFAKFKMRNCQLSPFCILEIWIVMWFPVRKKYTSESQKNLFLHLADLKASITVEKSNFWSKSLSVFNRNRLFNLLWVWADLRADLMRLRWLRERLSVQFVTGRVK